MRRLLVLICVGMISSPALAQSPANGSDEWTAMMQQIGLFKPRVFTLQPCDSTTEASVGVPYDTTNPSGSGFCIEKDERTAATWDAARNTCLKLGKRLPEPGEWLIACKNATALSLNNMTNDYEWVSNFWSYDGAGGLGFMGVGVVVAGGATCTRSTLAQVISNASGGPQDTPTYRCVR